MDARKLLREQRSARQIKHPHAFYASSGLRCSVCRIPVKVESKWGSHTQSAQHLANLKAQQDLDKQHVVGRKRKASDSSDEGRKKVKNTLPEIPENEELNVTGQDLEEVGDNDTIIANEVKESGTQQSEATTMQRLDDAPDNTDWNEFLEDAAAIEAQQVAEDAARIRAQATISAPALSAAEIAAQAREEQSQQRGTRDEEIRQEREEAQDNAADEMEKMEEFEARVQALRSRKAKLAKLHHDQDLPKASMVSEDVQNESQDEDESEDDVDQFWNR